MPTATATTTTATPIRPTKHLHDAKSSFAGSQGTFQTFSQTQNELEGYSGRHSLLHETVQRASFWYASGFWKDAIRAQRG